MLNWETLALVGKARHLHQPHRHPNLLTHDLTKRIQPNSSQNPKRNMHNLSQKVEI